MISVGMTNYELEYFSKNRKIKNGISPWAFWESERNSFGKTFRLEARYPKFLPLFFSSDHGVTPGTAFEANEKFTTSKLYFSWNKNKVKILRESFNVNAVHCKNPWIAWRRKHFPKKSQNSNGTLLFWPHLHETVIPQIDLKSIKIALDSLPEFYKPIKIMLSSHDVNANSHIKLRDLDLPLITAGSIMSQNFVDNFYYILRNFNFGAGFTWGSHVFYCLEFGIPFKIFAEDSVKYKSLGTPEIPSGFYDHTAIRFPDPVEKKEFDRFMDNLKISKNYISELETNYALEQLGLFSGLGKKDFTWLVWSQLLLNFPKIPYLWFKTLYSQITQFKSF